MRSGAATQRKTTQRRAALYTLACKRILNRCKKMADDNNSRNSTAASAQISASLLHMPVMGKY